MKKRADQMSRRKRNRKYERNSHGHDHIILMNLQEKPKDLDSLKADMQTVAHRFFIPVEHAVEWLAFIAIIVSALICGLLWAVQRYVGRKSGAMALITQSIDSRNHVIVEGV